MKLLSSNQIAEFKNNGFLILKKFYNDLEVQQIKNWTDEIAKRPLEKGKLMVYFEESSLNKGQKIINRIEKFTDYHEGFHKLATEEKLLGRISLLLDTPAVLFKEKINYKLPGGDGFKAHQDVQSGWTDYVDFFITALVAVDDSTEENGCIELAPGLHKKGWLGRRDHPLEGKELENVQFIKYPMKAGDVVMFDCFTPHQSAPNYSRFPRRNIYLTYSALEKGDFRNQYFKDKMKNYPPDFEREPGKEYKYKV